MVGAHRYGVRGAQCLRVEDAVQCALRRQSVGCLVEIPQYSAPFRAMEQFMGGHGTFGVGEHARQHGQVHRHQRLRVQRGARGAVVRAGHPLPVHRQGEPEGPFQGGVRARLQGLPVERVRERAQTDDVLGFLRCVRRVVDTGHQGGAAAVRVHRERGGAGRSSPVDHPHDRGVVVRHVGQRQHCGGQLEGLGLVGGQVAQHLGRHRVQQALG